MVTQLLYVYILKCADGSYYTGITNNPEQRLEQHNLGFDKYSYTHYRRPVEMVYVEEHQDYNMAIAREKQIKRWTRVKKEALINNKWDKLRPLAECKNETSHLNRKD